LQKELLAHRPVRFESFLRFASVGDDALFVALAADAQHFFTPIHVGEVQAGEFAQGVVIQANVNVTIGTSGTAIVLRVRKGSLTGTLVGVAQTITAAAGNTVAATVDELDTTLSQTVTYVLTGQVTAGAANSTVNRAVLTAEDATAFE